MPFMVTLRRLDLKTFALGGSKRRTSTAANEMTKLRRLFRGEAPRAEPKLVKSRGELVLKRSQDRHAIVLDRLLEVYPARPLVAADEADAEQPAATAIDPEPPVAPPREKLDALLTTTAAEIRNLDALRRELPAMRSPKKRAAAEADLIHRQALLASVLEAAMPEASAIEGGRRAMHRQLLALAFGCDFAAEPGLADLLERLLDHLASAEDQALGRRRPSQWPWCGPAGLDGAVDLRHRLAPYAGLDLLRSRRPSPACRRVAGGPRLPAR
jgi:hypothetical protein